MKKIILILAFCIVCPHTALSQQVSEIIGYWKSENKDPLNQYKILEISKNSFKDGGKKPQYITMEKENSEFIIKFTEFKNISREMYDTLFYKIIPVNKDKIIVNFPTAGGTRNEWIYNRVTKEEAQKCINAPINFGNLKPTEDPAF